MTKPASISKCRRGATAVEFALVAPIFLLIILGVFEVGRLFWIKSSMQYAVEESARYVMLNTSTTTSALETYATTTVVGSFTGDITYVASKDTSTTPYTMTITATYAYTPLVDLIKMDAITLSTMSKVPLNE